MGPLLLCLAIVGLGGPVSGRRSPAPDVEGRFGELVDQLDGLVDPIDLHLTADGGLWVVLGRPRRLVGFVESARGTYERRTEVELDARAVLVPTPDGAACFVDGPGPGTWLDLDVPPSDAAEGPPEREPPAEYASPGALPTSSLGWWRGGSLRLLDGGPDGAFEPLAVADAAFLPDGRLLAVDAALHEVVALDREGRVSLRLGDFGHFPGQLSAPSGVAVHGDRIYVADTHNHRIQVRTLDGELLYEWGKHALLPRQGRGHLHYPTDVGVAPDGTRAAVLEPIEGRVQVFGPATRPADAYRTDPATLGADPTGHFGPPVAARGRYAATLEPETQELHVHDLDSASGTPVLVGRAGGYGAALGEFRGAVDLALAPEGDLIWVLDAVERRLSAFTLIRDEDEEPRFRRDRVRYTASVELGSLIDGLERPEAIAAGPEGAVWIADPGARRVWRVASDLRRATSAVAWSEVDAPGPERALDLSVGPDGSLAIAGEERLWRRVSGPEPEHGGSSPRGGAQVVPSGGSPFEVEAHRAGGVAHDGDGRLWWTDREAHRVVAPAGALGSGPGLGRLEFDDPRGLALTGDGRLVVVDHRNHRLQVWSVSGELLGLAGPRPYLREALGRSRRASEPAREGGASADGSDGEERER